MFPWRISYLPQERSQGKTGLRLIYFEKYLTMDSGVLKNRNEKSTPISRDNNASTESTHEIKPDDVIIKSNPDVERLEMMEKLVLTKIDKLLGKFELKLSNMEKYLEQSAVDVENTASTILSYTPSYSNLVSTLKSIKGYLQKNQQHSLHPLTKIIDDYYEQEKQPKGEDKKHSLDEKAHSTLANSTQTFQEYKQQLFYAIQVLNARLTDFEKHHNLPPLNTHPSERLIALKETLYNYDVALTTSKKRHLTFYELPFQWRENKYIIYGYRFATSHFSAMTSWLHWHNETVNIWTHLLGSAYMVYLGLVHFPQSEHFQTYAASLSDKAVMYLFISSSIICMMFSVFWHSYANIGFVTTRSKFACFDYSGIVILISSSIISTEHISLKGHLKLKLLFMGFSSIAGIVGIIMAWHPYFDRPESRILRILFFISLSFLGVVAFSCSCFFHSIQYCLNLFFPLLFSFVWYLSGVVFYGSFFPECCRTDVEVDNFEISDETIMQLDREGKFLEYLHKQPVKTCNHGITSLWWIDWIGNSHNLWHLFVIGGVLGHYKALLDMFKYGYEHQ